MSLKEQCFEEYASNPKPPVEWITILANHSLHCVDCKGQDEKERHTCRYSVDPVSDDEFATFCNLKYKVDCNKYRRHYIGWNLTDNDLMFPTGCTAGCSEEQYCKSFFVGKELEPLLSYLTESNVPACEKFPKLLIRFAHWKNGKGLPKYTVEECERIVKQAIARCGEWNAQYDESTQGTCERCGHEGYLPDGKHCSNCNQIILFQANQEKEEQRRIAENIPPVPPVHTCGYCEKPIPSDRVVRYRVGVHGITLFLHEECAQAIAEKETEPLDALEQDIKEVGENSRVALHTFKSGAVRYPTGTRYDLASPIAFKFCVDDARIRALIWYLLYLHRKTEKVDDERIAYVLFELLKDALKADKGTIIRLYAAALNEGAEKYPPRNWELGIPEENLVSHAVNHAVLLDRNDTAENHASHLVWNVFSIIHFRLKDKIDAILQA